MRTGKYEASEGGSSAGTAVTFSADRTRSRSAAWVCCSLPKPVSNFRKDLRKKYDSARETVEDWTDDAKDFAEEAMERGAEIADEVRERVAPLAKAMRR